MLRTLPQQKHVLPYLRHISIRFAECGSPYEILTRIQPLQEQLQAVGIQLEMQELDAEEMEGRLSISLDRGEETANVSWFLDPNPVVENPLW
jgi:hypothetical protein